MARVAIYHPIFGTGGGEAVCMNVLECLEDDHELVLYTLSDPDIPHLNEYFNTDVSPSIEVDDGFSGEVLGRSYDLWSAGTESGLGRLHASLFGRLLRSKLDAHDLVVSTFGEFDIGVPTVQYVHYPMFNRRRIPSEIEARSGARWVYDEACDLVSGHWRRAPDASVLLANSNWTAELTETVHGVPTETLYPPVDTTGFHPEPWEEREEGFVAIGRVEPSKRIEDLVEIVERVQNRGHDIPLHVVGPTPNNAYRERLEDLVAGNDDITLEGSVSREELVDYVCSYRYGIHGMHYEHFGIVVAEFVAGGALPFVHDSGGQREIVGDEDVLRYHSIPDAVEKIDAVLSDPDEQARLRRSLPDVEEQFGKARFQQTFAQVIADELDR